MSTYGMVLQTHKRKEPADHLPVDCFSNDTVSPLKKSRIDYQLYPILEEEKQFIPPAETSAAVFLESDQILIDSRTSSFESPGPSVPVTQTAPDEKAIVLYRPINAPGFPGGPPAGSADLPMKLNTLLPCTGFHILGSNSTLFPSSDKLHNEFLKNLPNSSSSLDDSSIEQNEPSSAESSLAIIPWLASPPAWHSFGNSLTSQATLCVADPGISDVGESSKEEFFTNEESAKEMQIDDQAEDMAIEEENSMMSNPLPAQRGSSVSSFNYPLWQQHCGYLETSYTPVTWST